VNKLVDPVPAPIFHCIKDMGNGFSLTLVDHFLAKASNGLVVVIFLPCGFVLFYHFFPIKGTTKTTVSGFLSLLCTMSLVE